MGYICIFKVLSNWELRVAQQKKIQNILLDIKIFLEYLKLCIHPYNITRFLSQTWIPIFIFYIWFFFFLFFFFFRSEWIENVLLYSKRIIKIWKLFIYALKCKNLTREYNSILKNITILIECFFYYIVYKNDFSIFNLCEKLFSILLHIHEEKQFFFCCYNYCITVTAGICPINWSSKKWDSPTIICRKIVPLENCVTEK